MVLLIKLMGILRLLLTFFVAIAHTGPLFGMTGTGGKIAATHYCF